MQTRGDFFSAAQRKSGIRQDWLLLIVSQTCPIEGVDFADLFVKCVLIYSVGLIKTRYMSTLKVFGTFVAIVSYNVIGFSKFLIVVGERQHDAANSVFVATDQASLVG